MAFVHWAWDEFEHVPTPQIQSLAGQEATQPARHGRLWLVQ